MCTALHQIVFEFDIFEFYQRFPDLFRHFAKRWRKNQLNSAICRHYRPVQTERRNCHTRTRTCLSFTFFEFHHVPERTRNKEFEKQTELDLSVRDRLSYALFKFCRRRTY